MTVALPMEDWQELGVRSLGGAALPADAPEAAMVSGTTRHFLVYRNYDALLEYNCSHSYAVSVGMLAGQMSGAAKGASATARTRAPRRPVARKRSR